MATLPSVPKLFVFPLFFLLPCFPQITTGATASGMEGCREAGSEREPEEAEERRRVQSEDGERRGAVGVSGGERTVGKVYKA